MSAANTGCTLTSTVTYGATPGTTRGATPGRGFGMPTVRILLVGLADLLITWQERAMQRHRLAGLDERELKDVALSRADIAPEVGKPFWRA